MIMMAMMMIFLIHNNRSNNPESKTHGQACIKTWKTCSIACGFDKDLGHVAVADGVLLVVTDDDDNGKNTNLDLNTYIEEDDCPTTTVESGLSLLLLSLWSPYPLLWETRTITTD